MNKIVILLLVSFPAVSFSQNVGIGINTPHPNAMLDITGINKGILIPRGDAATRTALNTNTARGLLLFDTVTNTIWIHNGSGFSTGWNNLSNGTNFWILNPFNSTTIKNTNPGGFWSENPTTVSIDPGVIALPNTDPGTKLIWIPAKSAFRVGTITNTQWGDENTGTWSFASGFNAIARGRTSFAMGINTNAFGDGSVVWGANSTAIGENSTAIGVATVAKSFSSLAIGRYNDSIAGSDPSSWIATDPLLTLGNGTANNARSNAFAVYKNGNIDISGYTQLGKTTEAAPAIKMKKLTGTSAAAQGAVVTIPHGLTRSKIIGVQVLLNYAAAGGDIPASYLDVAGYEYNWQVTNADINIYNKAGNSINILSKPVKILITYEE